MARLGLALSLLVVSMSVSTVAHTHAAAASTVLFSDGFESGTFSAWGGAHTGGDGSAVAQSATVKSGTYAARLSATTNAGSFAYLRKALAAPQADLTASADVDVAQEGAANSNVPILQLYDPVGTVVVRLYRQNATGGQIWLQYNGNNYYQASATLPLNTWAHVDLHVTTAGSGASSVQVLMNGAQVYASTAASLGTAGVQGVQLGYEVASQAFILFADNVTVSTNGSAPSPSPTPTTTATPSPTATPQPPSGSSASLLRNGSFENTGSGWLWPWNLSVYSGAAATIWQDGSTRADGTYAAVVDVTRSSSTNWEVQLQQGGINLTAGQQYIIAFAVRAPSGGTIQAILQQPNAPYNVVWSQSVSVWATGTWWQPAAFTYTPSTSQSNLYLRFNLASMSGNVWIDSAAVTTGNLGSAPPNMGKGISWAHPDAYWGGNTTGINSDLSDMNKAGITWARVDLNYTTSLTVFDAIVSAARSHNIQLLVTIRNGYPAQSLGTDADRATYRAWLAQMVNRYKYWVKYWEAGNEDNLHVEWAIDETPTSDPTAYAASVHNYVLHLQDTYSTIKATDPTAKVLLCGLSEWTSERFIYRLIQENAYQYFDIMSFHPYGGDPSGVIGRYNSARAHMAAQPQMAAKPIWVTEMGFNTSWTDKAGYVSSEQTKATYLTQTMQGLRADNAALPIYWYTLHEDGWTGGYGLEEKDATTLNTSYLPAFWSYQSLSLN